MHPYRAIPLLRPLTALIMGLLAGYQLPGWNVWLLIAAGIALLAWVIAFQYLSLKQRLTFYWTAGIAFLSLFFLLGYFAVQRKDIMQRTDWLGKRKDSIHTFAVVLEENPSLKPKNYLTTGNMIAMRQNNRYASVSGRILLRIDTSLQDQYHFLSGDTLLVQMPVRTIQHSAPGRFDAAAYYNRLQIYHQATIRSQNLKCLHTNSSKGIGYFLQQSRTWILQKLQTYIPEKDNLGLAEALLIGYKDDLDKNLENAYRDAGIVHIIAISGMHLIVLYKLLEQTGLLFSRSLSVKRLTKLLSLVVVWLFAFLSGAGPSVVRAAVMLSFIVAGELLYRNNNSLNSLVASAFVLLVVQPEWIWNVGFWLSYMAVLGILVFYRPILEAPGFTHPFLRTVWEGIAVTLAAQILTLPVLMYCFGKVPLYFLFTNLLMVPLSSIVLYAAIVLLATSWIPFLAHIVGKMTDGLIGLMNGFVRHVAQYPLANISLSVSFVQMLFLYGIIGAVCYLARRRRDKRVYALGSLS